MGNTLHKALFLDRDGVINYDVHYLYKKEDFKLLPGIVELCLAAQSRGYKLAIITNQSGIARGMYTQADLSILHQHMLEELAKHGIHPGLILFCPHHPDFNGNCLCRKPGNLLYQRAASLLHIDPTQSFALGDKQRDLDPGKSLGCTTVGVGQEPGLKGDILVERPDELVEFL